VLLRTIRSRWGKHHAAAAVASWLRLSTSHELRLGLVAAQTDTLAMGAREAIESEAPASERVHWLALPFLGCDGCKNTGQVWTDEHLLAATVYMPLLSGIAIQLLHKALRGISVEARTLIMPEPLSCHRGTASPPIDFVRQKTYMSHMRCVHESLHLCREKIDSCELSTIQRYH